MLPVHRHRGELYVAGEPGHEYEIRLRSREHGRVLAVTSVDGVNVLSGETAATSQGGYVLDGWRKNLDEVAAFYFTRLRNSYAARTGRPDHVGVIGIAASGANRAYRRRISNGAARRPTRWCASTTTRVSDWSRAASLRTRRGITARARSRSPPVSCRIRDATATTSDPAQRRNRPCAILDRTEYCVDGSPLAVAARLQRRLHCRRSPGSNAMPMTISAAQGQRSTPMPHQIRRSSDGCADVAALEAAMRSP